MKYVIESTDNGCVECLEYMGRKFKKEWIRTETGARCNDPEFNEQMESAGIEDEEVLEKTYYAFDSFFASEFMDLAEMYW